MNNMNFSEQFLDEAKRIIDAFDYDAIEKCVEELALIRERQGRLFVLGVGGSAANASHAVNDFRKISGLECYTPTDNIAELTARINDDGWESVFVEWLKGSKLNSKDGILILSVGGGSKEKNVSVNLIHAIDFSKTVGASIIGIIGRDGGYTAKNATAYVCVPPLFAEHITPHTEAFQVVIWHLIVSHPKLKLNQTKWESFDNTDKK
jgi:D-sedoheptulose 7-phosphate isomerase